MYVQLSRFGSTSSKIYIHRTINQRQAKKAKKKPPVVLYLLNLHASLHPLAFSFGEQHSHLKTLSGNFPMQMTAATYRCRNMTS